MEKPKQYLPGEGSEVEVSDPDAETGENPIPDIDEEIADEEADNSYAEHRIEQRS